MRVSSATGRSSEEKRAAYAPRAKSTRKILILAVIVAFALIIAAVVIPLYFFVIKPSSHNNIAKATASSNAATPSISSGAGPGANSNVRVTGGNGSTVTTENGTTFVYQNPFGGYWYWDENDPFNQSARAQSWSPALNETFNYGVDQVRGVNLGGWLVLEPFISPTLFQQYPGTVDEWTLSVAMAADTANGGLEQIEQHYQTFITEQDFAEIAGAGLNFVRIPIGFWAIETRPGEPFLPNVSWTYFLKAIQWARKYGLRINLDLHAVPGSQNGWNHSGRLGGIGWLNGPMGYANAQRSQNHIRTLAEFISQPEYKDVVCFFGILNEPQASVIGQNTLSRFYLDAYNIVREAGGTGTGNGPYVLIHDGFLPRSDWVGVVPDADRLALDSHPYLCFDGQSSAPMSTYAQTPCQTWGGLVNASMATFGFTNAGEFSNAVTDCGLYLNGVGQGTRYEGTYAGVWPVIGNCSTWTDYENYDNATKAAILQFVLASMDALQNYFFWTWKIGPSAVSNKVESPAWSYQLGLQNGWMPTDPRAAIGVCGNSNPWTPPLQAWQTGGTGAGDIPTSVSASLAWPPATLSTGGAVSSLPSYTPTGTIITLPGPTFTSSGSSATATISVGDGWLNSADNQGFFVAIPSCTYLDPWVNPTSLAPSPLCSGAAQASITPAP